MTGGDAGVGTATGAPETGFGVVATGLRLTTFFLAFFFVVQTFR